MQDNVLVQWSCLNIVGITTILIAEYPFVIKSHPNPMDGILPSVKSALTKAYKQWTSSHVIRSDQINIQGMKKKL
jgi:hypothetical protein